MSELELTWLGQSGFILNAGGVQVACDLYLSDYCQKKSRLDHTRMMPIPVEPETLTKISHYLITHGHIDHFDPETIGPVASASSKAKFYAPADCERLVEEFFADQKSRFITVSSEKEYALGNNLRLIPVPAAHEKLEQDERGEYLCLSYLVIADAAKTAIFYAGDTMPYQDQEIIIGKHIPAGYTKILVLPINGRDRKRAETGFKGNLTLEESVELYHKLKADLLVPCHYGMFALNDIPQMPDTDYFVKADCNAIIPQVNTAISLQLVKEL